MFTADRNILFSKDQSLCNLRRTRLKAVAVFLPLNSELNFVFSKLHRSRCLNFDCSLLLISSGDQSPRARVPVYEPAAAPPVPVQHARQRQTAPVLRL